ncbi:hypothetical protein [Nonomuraea basaltis]|uniref:hypothetical protein n=1 Tax=Nonomuraea basaltis TaxID=2495887 RepID=UPI00110C4F86|nr:hypothetical protein [Nonomuraea basaltis]TMR99085.1 hypothetical protein EJK15_08960 [Nonomuraea basaltis]
MIVLWLVVGVLSVLVVICLLALVDQYKTLELIRAKLKLEDNPEPIALPQGPIAPSVIGLPSALDSAPHLLVLFLSTSCNTCRSIANELSPSTASNVWVVLEHAHTAEEGAEWLAAASYPHDRATVDLDGSVAAALGINITPSAVLYQEGEPLIAQSIPSFRQLKPLLSARTLPSSLTFASEGKIKL